MAVALSSPCAIEEQDADPRKLLDHPSRYDDLPHELERPYFLFVTMADSDTEKHPVSVEKVESLSSGRDSFRGDDTYAREELVDPAKDETLQRGLTARQISMIAVRMTTTGSGWNCS